MDSAKFYTVEVQVFILACLTACSHSTSPIRNPVTQKEAPNEFCQKKVQEQKALWLNGQSAEIITQDVQNRPLTAAKEQAFEVLYHKP